MFNQTNQSENALIGQSGAQRRIAETRRFLSAYSPFISMDERHLSWLAERITIGFYAENEVIVSPDQGLAACCYIVMQGEVIGEHQQGASIGQGSTRLAVADFFPLGALLAKRAVASVYRARENTFCLEFSASDFYELLEMSPQFNDFCTHRLALLLEESKSLLQTKIAQDVIDQLSMNMPLSHIMEKRSEQAIYCNTNDSVAIVLAMMTAHALSSIVVTDTHHKPAGIFTLRDVLVRVAQGAPSIRQQSIRSVMTANLVLAPETTSVYDAVLLLTRHNIKNIVVTDAQGAFIGLVSEGNLFAWQRLSLGQIQQDIRNATKLEHLKQVSQDIRQLVQNMLMQEVATDQIIAFISMLKDKLVQRVIEWEFQEVEEQQINYCWVTFASAGRGEQTLNTVQTNALIFNGEGEDRNGFIQKILIDAARRVNHMLAECDFPFKPHRMLAGNAQGCLSLRQWQVVITQSLTLARSDGTVHADFFDVQAVAGDVRLAERIRQYAAQQIEIETELLKHIALNAIETRPPLDWNNQQGIDLKHEGIMPFVNSVRAYSLRYAIQASSTAERLRELARPMMLLPAEIVECLDAFYFIQRLRLKQQVLFDDNGTHDHINPASLSETEQRNLKEAFRHIRQFQTRLAENALIWA
jgi:CBS domain-containing protein